MDPAALKEVLRNTLDNLGKAAFKTFKHHLLDLKQIKYRQLDEADTADTVHLMVRVYDSEAGAVTLFILKKLNEKQLAESLEKELTEMGVALQCPDPAEKEGKRASFITADSKMAVDVPTRIGVAAPQPRGESSHQSQPPVAIILPEFRSQPPVVTNIQNVVSSVSKVQGTKRPRINSMDLPPNAKKPKKTPAQKSPATSKPKKTPSQTSTATSKPKKTPAQMSTATSKPKKTPAQKPAATSKPKKTPAQKPAATNKPKKTPSQTSAATSKPKKTKVKKPAATNKPKKTKVKKPAATNKAKKTKVKKPAATNKARKNAKKAAKRPKA